MSVSWTEEMSRALAAQSDAPQIATASGHFVLVRADDYARLRQKHADLPEVETIADPSGRSYALVPMVSYHSIRSVPSLSPDTGLAPPHTVHGFRRGLYVAFGLFFVALALVGVVTPILPTTPFLLLAAFFFARSSSRLHHWLLRSRVFGGLLRDWQRHRGVRPRVKVVALTLMPAVVFTSAYFGKLPWYLVALLIGLALIGAVVVLRLKTIRDQPAESAEPTRPTNLVQSSADGLVDTRVHQ